MKLLYSSDYLSIKKFNPIDSPDFMVITGVNGAGKSHLLKSIENRNVLIEGIEDENIVYFNYVDFFLENESIFNIQTISSDRDNAWNLFNQYIKNPIKTWKEALNEFQDGYELIKGICNDKMKSIWDLDQSDINNTDLFSRYTSYKKNINSLFRRDTNISGNQSSPGIMILIKKLKYSIDEISETEFRQLYQPYNLKNDFLPVQLGRIFWDYFLKWKENEMNRGDYEKKHHNRPFLNETAFINRYGEKPWSSVEIILEKFRTLDFRINTPEDYGIMDNYKFELKSKTSEINIDFNDLSSGEKVLMALVSSIYKLNADKHFPSILLLDEIDASLHPSMIKNLLETINDIFVSRGTKVIMATHSPTTIALIDESSVYVMQKEGEDRIQKVTKFKALNILTEGYATLEEGLKLLDQVTRKKVSIISEGYNTEFIEKIIDLYLKEFENEIELINGFESRTGKDQLGLIFDFFKVVKHSTKVLVVWDPDVNNVHTDSNNTYAFTLPKNGSNVNVTSGIESLFDDKLFKPRFYTKSKTKEGGTLHKLDKNKFRAYILSRNELDKFKNFEPLVNKIKSLL